MLRNCSQNLHITLSNPRKNIANAVASQHSLYFGQYLLQISIMAETKSSPTIKLYTAQTPNGVKISITLEELGLPYEVHKIDFSKQEQKEPWFLEINPNGRIPALTDTFSDGQTIRLFESGAIMQYLVERYDTEHKISYPHGSREVYEEKGWLFFLNAGVGPMQVCFSFFERLSGYVSDTI